MTAQNFPDKHQANSLPVRLGRKEGTEEFSFSLFCYTFTIICHLNPARRISTYLDFSILLNTLSCILYDIH